jgi:hypothetical protein
MTKELAEKIVRRGMEDLAECEKVFMNSPLLSEQAKLGFAVALGNLREDALATLKAYRERE